MLQLLIASVLLLPQSPAKTAPQRGCAVSHSLAELKRAFDHARVPLAVELTGSWVAIGDFIQTTGPGGKESDDVNCAGLTYQCRAREDPHVQRCATDGSYSVEPYDWGFELKKMSV